MLSRLLFAIFAICSVTVVYSRSLDECTRNPQEWCSNFTTATECNVVKHCIEDVWSKFSQFLPKDSKCSTCIQQIDNIRDGIDSNTTKEVIEEALEYVCEISFFTRILRKQCEQLIDKYVDTHINELLDLLRSNVDSQVICKVLDFCSTPEDVEPEDAAVYYDNIVLHIPASNLQIVNIIERPAEPELVGAEKCTWGPSYWCGNLSTSKECKSTSHCIATFWSTKQFEEDNDSVCQVCKDMVKQARDQLLSNETQEELIEVLEGSCKLIPLKEVRKECITLADEFVPELTEMLASQMNPTAVCTIAGLCNSPRIDAMLAEGKEADMDLSGVDSCVNCTVAFTAFERYMQSATKEDVLGKLLAVCSQFSSYSDLCASLIVSNMDDIYDVLRNQLPPPAACHLSGMCAYRYHAHISINDTYFQNQVSTILATPNDDLPCDLCKQLVHHFQEILVANTTEDEFRQMLQGMCQQTGKFKEECLKLVDDNFQVIYKFLTEELDPVKICAEIQICPRSKNYVSDTNLNLISGRVIPVLKDGVQLSSLMPVSPSKLAAASTASSDGQVDSVECKFCHTVIGVIRSELQDPVYEKDVEKVIEKVCTLVPKSDKARCDEFMNDYADVLIKTLADEADPFVVCRILKICPTAPNPQAAISTSDELCPLCQYLLHYLQDALDDPNDEVEIEAAVKKFCSIVPNSMKNKCEEFISQYSALVISILSQEIDPSLVCPALKLCPSSASPKERCLHCRLFVADLINRLDSNYELGNIENKVANASGVKGLEKSVTALELRVSHREELIDMMTAEFDADEVCVYAKFCDVKMAALPVTSNFFVGGDVDTNEIVNSPVSETKPSCEICELFVKMYEKELTSNKTEDELEAMLEKVCSKMKDADREKNCYRLVKKYVPVFFDLLKKDVSPRELCAAAKLCSFRTLTRSQEAPLAADLNTECNTCEVAVGSLESVLGDPLIKNNIFERAVKVCDTMKGKSHTLCVNIITEVLPQVEGLLFDVPPWFVCSKMKMCPYGYRINMDACSNPELWCQDIETAFKCERLLYCRKNVWTATVP